MKLHDYLFYYNIITIYRLFTNNLTYKREAQGVHVVWYCECELLTCPSVQGDISNLSDSAQILKCGSSSQPCHASKRYSYQQCPVEPMVSTVGGVCIFTVTGTYITIYSEMQSVAE